VRRGAKGMAEIQVLGERCITPYAFDRDGSRPRAPERADFQQVDLLVARRSGLRVAAFLKLSRHQVGHALEIALGCIAAMAVAPA